MSTSLETKVVLHKLRSSTVAEENSDRRSLSSMDASRDARATIKVSSSDVF